MDYFVTFWPQLPEEVHLRWGAAHHLGYLRMSGPQTYGEARNWAWRLLGNGWADIHDEPPGISNPGQYSMGEIGRVDTTVHPPRIQDARVYRGVPAARLANAVVAHRMCGGTDEQYAALEAAFEAWVEANDAADREVSSQ